MSTGPGPTRKADGSPEASVDDIADLLVEDESHQSRVEGDQSVDDGLDVMLETPGPALVSTFMPPPPSPVAEDVEENDSVEEPGEATNLAYEDLLAKLVLPAKPPEPEPAMPALAATLPPPESMVPPTAPTPPAVAFQLPSSPSFLVAPPTDERTLVTDNPLVAEEQEAAYREGRTGSRSQAHIIVQEEMRPALTEPMAVENGGAKSRLLYLMLGGLLVLGGMILAVLVLKLLMPTPAPQPAVVVAPAPSLPPAPPPAHVEPLPPSAPVAVPPPAAAEPGAAAPAEAAAEGAAPENERAQAKAHRAPGRKAASAHVAAPRPAPRAPAAGTKVVPVAKTPKAKKVKSSGYADPFDN